MTIKQFEGLSDEEKNQAVCEAMGRCWHEDNDIHIKTDDFHRVVYFCDNCGKEYFNNINYLTSAEGLREMMEWCREKHYIEIHGVSGVCWRIDKFNKNIIEESSLNLALCYAVLRSAGKIEEV